MVRILFYALGQMRISHNVSEYLKLRSCLMHKTSNIRLIWLYH